MHSLQVGVLLAAADLHLLCCSKLAVISVRSAHIPHHCPATPTTCSMSPPTVTSQWNVCVLPTCYTPTCIICSCCSMMSL